MSSSKDAVPEYEISMTPILTNSAVPLKVWRVNAASGVRTLVKTLALPDMSAINQIEIRHWSDDGPYAYSYARELSQLFIVSGVK